MQRTSFEDPPEESRRIEVFRREPLRGVGDLRPPLVRSSEDQDPALPEQSIHLPEKHKGHNDIVQQIEGANKIKRLRRNGGSSASPTRNRTFCGASYGPSTLRNKRPRSLRSYAILRPRWVRAAADTFP